MTRVPDPARSRAVLIGTGHHKQASNLPELPAVRANLLDLRAVLTDAVTGTVQPEHCVVVGDPEVPAHIGNVVTREAAEATDLLLVYYSGHGLVDERGRLHLALSTTDPERLRWTALPFEVLREEIANSPAAVRVLVLDCCFSGRAFEAMSSDSGVVAGQIDIVGTYTLASSSANTPSYAPADARNTAFTEALLAALRNPQQLTLDEIFGHVHRHLTSRGLPKPQRRTVNAGGNIALVKRPISGPLSSGFGPQWPIPLCKGSAPAVVPARPQVAPPIGRRILELPLSCLLTLMICADVQLPFPYHAGPNHPRLPYSSLLFSIYGLYALPFGILLLLGRPFSSRLRHHHVFAVGLAVFNIAALLCATTPSAHIFYVARFAQGAGAALIFPYAVPLILNTVPAVRWRAAISLWALLAAAATVYGDRRIFLITFAYNGGVPQILLLNLSIGMLALWLVPPLFPPSTRTHQSTIRGERPLSSVGSFTLVAGAAALTKPTSSMNSVIYWGSLYLLASGIILLSMAAIRRWSAPMLAAAASR